MNEFILQLTFFSSMNNVMHSYSTPGKYQVLSSFSMGSKPEPYEILFECPIEVHDAFKDLQQVISQHYTEYKPGEVDEVKGEPGFGAGNASASDQMH